MKKLIEGSRLVLKEVNLARRGFMKGLSSKAGTQWRSWVDSGKSKNENSFEFDFGTIKKASSESRYAVKGLVKDGIEKASRQWGVWVQKGCLRLDTQDSTNV